MLVNLLQKYLYCLAAIVLWRYKPKIVAITGNVGKTSAKEAILAVLSPQFSVRGPEKNFNNEIGVPLTILGWHNYGRNIFGWLGASLAYPLLLAGVFRYPRILVLEMGADRPGDIDYLTRLARPDISLVTAVGEIPVHVEFFSSPEALAEEKSILVERTNPRGTVILNADDRRVLAMRSLARTRVMLYGTLENANIRIENVEAHLNLGQGSVSWGWLTFKISDGGTVTPIYLSGAINPVQSLAAAAAYAVGKVVGASSVEIAEALQKYQPPAGRTRIIRGVNGSVILDDTYNAAPAAVEAGLAALAALPGKRKIAVLGDMKELGKYNEAAHKKIGELAAGTADILVAVGESAKMMQKASASAGADVRWVENSREAAAAILPMIQAGDVVLVKGAQSMRMERVVEDLMAEPQKAKDLLVRQTADWKQRG